MVNKDMKNVQHFSLKGNANKNYIWILFHPPHENKKTNVGDDVRKKEPFYVFGGM
jgi:hypothetical protein